MCFISTQMTMKMDGFHQVIAEEKNMSIQGDGQVILKIQNLHEVWEEGLHFKASYKTDEERRNAMLHKKPKYHVGRGKHLKRFGDGWTDNVRE
jgi:hypothetical protein